MKTKQIVLSVLLVVSLVFGCLPVQAQLTQIEATDSSVVAVSYLDEYNNYENVIGCLNSNGTKSVYIFGDGVSRQAAAQTVADVTGLAVQSTTTTAATPYTLIEDAAVYSDTAYADKNYGNLVYYEVGDSTKGTARSYLRFDLSSLNVTDPNNIISAYYYMANTNTTDNAHVEAYLVKEAWSESTITWNNRPDYYAGELISSVTLDYHANSDDYVGYPDELYLTKAVMAWIQGVPNYGIMLKEVDDGVRDWETAVKKIYSSERGESNGNKPYLCITYATDTLTQTPGIISGKQYFLMNRNSEKYLQAASLISGSSVYQNTGNGSTLQAFTLNHVGNGYYSIQVGNSSAYLNASAGSLTSVTVGPYNATYGQWKIVRNWDGGYRIYNKGYSTRVLYLSASATANNAVVTLNTYTHNYSFNDEWSIMPVDRGSSSLFYFTNEATGDINTSYGMSYVESVLEGTNAGFSNVQHQVNQSAAVGYPSLRNDAIFVFSGHGNRSLLSFYSLVNGVRTNSRICTEGEETSESTILFNRGNNVLGENGMAHQQLMLIQSCLSGCSLNDTSLVGEAYRLGSHNIISNTATTYNYGNNPNTASLSPDYQWMMQFFLNLGVSRNIRYAKARADELIYDEHVGVQCTVSQRNDLGDESVYLLSYPLPQTSSAQSLYQDELTVLNRSNTANNRDSVQVLLNGEQQTLTYIATTDADSLGNSYDSFVDINGGLYSFIQGTNQLRSYQPYTGTLKLGETIVNKEDAFILADEVLSNLGYDVTDFECTYSNDYSKNYRIRYQYYVDDTLTTERITLYMQADANGDVYLTNFIVSDYGLYSTNTAE